MWNVCAIRTQAGPFSKPLRQQSVFLIKTCMLFSLFSTSLRHWNYCSRLKFWLPASGLITPTIAPPQPLTAPYPRMCNTFLSSSWDFFLPGLNKADRTRQIVPGSAVSCVSQASKNSPCPHMAFCGQLQEIYTECFLENYFFTHLCIVPGSSLHFCLGW